MYLGYLSSEGSQVAFETFLSLFFFLQNFSVVESVPRSEWAPCQHAVAPRKHCASPTAREPAAQYHARMTLRARATLARVGSVEIKA